MESPPQLTGAQRRKLLIWKRLVIGSLAGAGIFALLEITLFFRPGTTRATKLTVGGILGELVVSAAILGASGRCPACGSRFGMDNQGLAPRRCRRCGVGLA